MKRRSLSVGREQAGIRLAQLLSGALAISPEEAAALVQRGAVYVAGRRTQLAELKLGEGAKVMVVLEEGGASPLTAPPAQQAPALLWEDEAVLAVDKPAGLPSQPTASRVGTSALDWAKEHAGGEVRLVHRLDRETSGVLLLAKTARAASLLSAQFRSGTVRKRYLAGCGPGLLEAGTIDLPLSADPSRPGRYRATRAANGAPAITRYVALHRDPEHCLVALFPQTGRTHQLRAHLTALGAPILGDARYGGRSRLGDLAFPRCLLHAQALCFAHPLTEADTLLEASVPADLGALFAKAGVSPPSGRF